jgi:hypothetical protein
MALSKTRQISRALRHPIYSRADLDRFLRETSAPIG